MNVILISGKIGSGKDTTASMVSRLLTMQGYNSNVQNLSRPLKRVVAYLKGEDEGLFDDRSGKDSNGKDQDLNRQLLVAVGKAAASVDPDIFSRWTFNEFVTINAGQRLAKFKSGIGIVSDLRLKRELNYFDTMANVYVIRLKGSLAPSTNPEMLEAIIETDLDHLDGLCCAEPCQIDGEAADSFYGDHISAFRLKPTDPERFPELTEQDIERNKTFNIMFIERAVFKAIDKFKKTK